MYFLATDTAGVITDALRSLMLSICELIYKLIIYFFNIFEIIGTAEILKDSTVQEIYGRIGLILGLFMIFRVTISFVQYLIDPDVMLDKKNGVFNIVKRIFIVIILLGTTPSLFNLAFDLQDMIIDQGIIPKIITGKSSSGTGDFGGDLAWFTFNSFYRIDQEFIDDQSVCPDLRVDDAKNISKMQDHLIRNKSLRLAFNCVNDSREVEYEDRTSADVYTINFDGHGLMAVIVGAFILWMIVLYTIQVGVRLIQLAYLQLIAPVPIMLYLDPKGDDRLKKWFGQCTSTYLDFFIRTAVIYLVVFVIDLLIGNGKDTFLNSLGNVDFWTQTYITVIMILALLVFAKRVPDLFKELFPTKGKFDYGLKLPKEAKQAVGVAAGALAGGAIGLIGGPGVGGRVKGLLGGITKGAMSGAKGKKISEITSARAAQNIKNRQIRDSESTFGGRVEASVRNTFGFESSVSFIDRQIEQIDNNPVMEENKKYNSIISARKAMVDEAEKELLKKDNALKTLKLTSDYMSAHIGEKDSKGRRITAESVLAAQARYKEALDKKVESWIDSNADSNDVLARNMQIISNQTGTVINTASGAKTASDNAKKANAGIASTVANLEHKKAELNKSKRIAQANQNAIKK